MYYVTGVSRGLGKAIALALLEKGHAVTGIGRSHSIEHSSFTFILCDLGDSAAMDQLEFPVPAGPITLINNAGIIGEIGRLSEQNSLDLAEVLAVNTVAPTVLATKIYNQVSDKNTFSLVNISSGAANRAIPSWAAYCASKAALNMLSEAFFLEERELGFSPKVYAVAPGVIDTDMQGQIRNASEEQFSAVQNFIDMKANEVLFSAEEAARKLLLLLEKPYNDTVFSDLRTV
jgi:benzil reductase ((S)-benzoin forming)